MQLFPWSHPTSAGFTLTGWHSQPSGKPLLQFLHGNGFCGRAYEPMLAPLAEHFDLWLCDAQGHGETEHGGRFHGWNRSAELALEAFETGRDIFGDVPCFALGHSFGGVLTCLILARHPELFRRTVLLDPVLFSKPMIGVMALSELLGLHRRNVMAKKSAARRRHWPDRATAFSLLQGRGIFRGWTDAALQAYVDHALKEAEGGGVELKCRPSREVDIFSSYPKRLWPSLAKVSTKSLLLYGNKTYPFVGQSARRLKGMNSMVSIAEVEGGHCFMQEHPEATAERVRSFLLAGN